MPPGIKIGGLALLLIPVGAWASYLTSLNLRLLISKRRIILHQLPGIVVRIKWNESKDVLSNVFDTEWAIKQ